MLDYLRVAKLSCLIFYELHDLAQLAGLGAAQADPATGKLLRVNPTLCRITDYSEGELLGLTFFEITHPEEAIARIQCGRSSGRYSRSFGGVRRCRSLPLLAGADAFCAPL